MKTPKILMTAVALTAFGFGLGSDAFSQARQQQPGQAQEQPATGQFEGLRYTDLIGSRVVNTEGERLGTIDDITLTLEGGSVPFVIVSAGGFLGIGGNLRPVPPESLQAREVAIGYELVLDVTSDQWERAPTINREQILQLSQAARGQHVYAFYGADWEARQQEVTQFAGPGERPEAQTQAQTQEIEQRLSEAMTEAGVDPQEAQQEAQRLAQQFVEERPDQREIAQQLQQALTQAGLQQQQARQEAQRLSQEVHQQIEFAGPDQQRQTQETTDGGEPILGPSQTQERPDAAALFEPEELQSPSEINLASELMNAALQNQQGEEIGEITDFLIDLQQGRVGYALVTSDTGFWQMGDAEFAIAPHSFDITGNRLVLNATAQDFEVAQVLTDQQLPDRVAQQEGVSPDQARQSPEILLYVGEEGTTPGVYGAPGRAGFQEQQSDTDQAEPDQREPGPPSQQDGQQPQQPRGQN